MQIQEAGMKGYRKKRVIEGRERGGERYGEVDEPWRMAVGVMKLRLLSKLPAWHLTTRAIEERCYG